MIEPTNGHRATGTHVSTVIPCHNGGRYIGETIRSVLGQPHDDLEFIDWLSRAEDLGVRVVKAALDRRRAAANGQDHA